MPMGGKGSRFSNFNRPKPLIEINGYPFFFWATQSIRNFISLSSLTFVILEEHANSFAIEKTILNYFPEANIKLLKKPLNGAVLTCIEGVKNIRDDKPIIFNDCDHIFHCKSFYDFCEKGEPNSVDGALLSFYSDDPKFSFLQYNSYGDVIKTVEKQVISNNAICGAYYFKNKGVFSAAAEQYLKECNYAEYFVSGLYNIMAEKGQKIINCNVDFHLPFGTPEEYNQAINSALFKVVL